MSFEKNNNPALLVPNSINLMTDINARDEEGQTQLHRAADAGDCDEVTRLLTDKADPELKENTDGFVRPRSFALRRVVWRKYDPVNYHLFFCKIACATDLRRSIVPRRWETRTLCAC